jgi:hypothetical protein
VTPISIHINDLDFTILQQRKAHNEQRLKICCTICGSHNFGIMGRCEGIQQQSRQTGIGLVYYESISFETVRRTSNGVLISYMMRIVNDIEIEFDGFGALL